MIWLNSFWTIFGIYLLLWSAACCRLTACFLMWKSFDLGHRPRLGYFRLFRMDPDGAAFSFFRKCYMCNNNFVRRKKSGLDHVQ